MYNKKCLLIETKIQHSKTIPLLETTYACKTPFEIINERKTNHLLRIEIRIIGMCINKKYEMKGIWRILHNKDSVTHILKKRKSRKSSRISKWLDSGWEDADNKSKINTLLKTQRYSRNDTLRT